jgi:hypothetical protein
MRRRVGTPRMKRIVKLDRRTARRAKTLGEVGELLARRILKRAGFTKVTNLNRRKVNFPYADVFATNTPQPPSESGER